MSNQLIPDEDYKIEVTSENGVFTVRSLDPNSPSNNGVLGEFTLNSSSTENLFDENNLPMITTLQELLSNLSEVLIRFDSNPKYYQKGDFGQLLKTLTESLIFLYSKFQLNQNLRFIGIADVNTDPLKDAIDLENKFPGIYLINTSGGYSYFGFEITDEQIQKSVILALPIIQNDVFVGYEIIIYNLNIYIPTKLSEFENDSNFASVNSIPTKLSQLEKDLNHDDTQGIQGGVQGQRYHLTLSQINKLDNSQEVLVSGTNIKTINGNSLLGSGNISIGEDPQYTVTFERKDAIWTDDWLTINSSLDLYNREITIFRFEMQTGEGIIRLNPVIAYPYAETSGGSATRAFYLKDSLGKVSTYADFDHIYLEYTISEPIVGRNNYDTRNAIGERVVQDESPGNSYHSREMRKVFLACYPELWTQYGVEAVESLNDPLAGNSIITASFEPKYMELKKANMLFRPYVNGALSEQTGSNPNILKVGAHYGNWPDYSGRHDITPGPDIFLSNVIAVAARVDDMATTEGQTSHGYGVEFFEDITTLDQEFPYKSYLRDRAVGTIDGTGYIYSAPSYPNWVSKSNFEVGEKVYINIGVNDHDNPEASTAERAVVVEIINDYTVRFETPLTPGSSKVAYIYGYLTMLGDQQQSPTCSIVGAKLKKIRLLTKANWQLVREAARKTASNSTYSESTGEWTTHWDMYRGFGKIRPDLAIQYIKDKYSENSEHLSTVANFYNETHRVNPFLKYSDLLNDSPVPKRHMHDVTENNYTDIDKAKVTELSPIFWDEDNNTYSFEIPDGGMIQINQEPHDYYTNLQGAQIVNGDIVSIIGASGNRTAIALTDSTNDAKALSCFGMVTVATIGNNNVGRITKSGGKVRGLNTAGYAEGTILYVNPASAGKWTGVKPVAPLRAIQIGVVSVSHAVEGVVELFIKVYPKFGELADVDGATAEILDAETVPVKKADGLIKFLSWANIKATLKTYFDGIYEKVSNKQNSLAIDGTGTKYPTVDAINATLTKVLSDTIYNANYLTGVWSADSTTDTLTSTAAHGLTAGIAISFNNLTGVLPGGISPEPEYYWVESIISEFSIKIKSLYNGTAVDITSNGSAGWGVRRFASGPAIAFDFSNNSEIEIISTDFSIPQAVNGNAYYNLTLSPASSRIFLNDINVYGATRSALLFSQMINKKYIKATLNIRIRKLFNYNYFVEVYINGIYSDVINLTSSSAALTRVFTGYITADSEITSIYIANGYTDTVKNGTRVIVLKRY